MLHVSVLALGPGGEGEALRHDAELRHSRRLLRLAHRWFNNLGLAGLLLHQLELLVGPVCPVQR